MKKTIGQWPKKENWQYAKREKHMNWQKWSSAVEEQNQ